MQSTAGDATGRPKSRSRLALRDWGLADCLPMDGIDLLGTLRADGSALAAAARRGLEPPVPACAGWTVADLVLHTGMVHRHKTEFDRGRLGGPPHPWPPPAPARHELLGWYEQGLEELATILKAEDPETHVWTQGSGKVSLWPMRGL